VPEASSYYAVPPPAEETESVVVPAVSSSDYASTPVGTASASTGVASSATAPGYPEYTGAAASTKPFAAMMAGAAALAYFV
jgi:hypothetical protein